MRITIVGTGYVGLVTGACFAEMGNHVTCVDTDEAKLEQLRKGNIPIHETGLDELVEHNVSAERLNFASSLEDSLNESEITFIAVGTPPNEDGSADLSHVLDVAREIGEKIAHPTVIADKSTVPVGTADLVRDTIASAMEKRGVEIEFDVISNPEFLREGSAVRDFMYPDRIVVGTTRGKSRRLMEELYGPFSKKEERIQFVGVRDAEMIKYAANAMLATKISFMNEVGLMCEHYGVDIENIRRGIGSDPRIGPHFIYPGCGYGGSCFPKDVKAMIDMARTAGIEAGLFHAVEERNAQQKRLLVEKIRQYFHGNLAGRRFALWGLAFKPNTDDIREAPSLVVLDELVKENACITVFDPEAMEQTRSFIPAEWEAEGKVAFAANPYDAVEEADALIVVTEWREFKQPDFRKLAKLLREKIIFDGRNIYDPERMSDYGLKYVGIGRSNLAEQSGRGNHPENGEPK